jgi:hypothetical protein
VCNASGTSCTEEWSPWPFLAVGVLLLVLGLVLFLRHERTQYPPPADGDAI